MWTAGQRYYAVTHSIRPGTPIPAIVMNRRPTKEWFAADGTELPLDVVIDGGKQRLSAVRAWLANEFAVPSSWFEAAEIELAEDTDDGPYVRFSNLTRRQQRFFEMSAHVPVAEASVGTTAKEAAIYLRVNGSGTAQTDEDMERAAQIAGR